MKFSGFIEHNQWLEEQTARELIGKKYPWITIIDYRTGFVCCQCICGRFCVWYRRRDVTSGKTTSCGCMHKEKLRQTRSARGQIVDYTGKEFGLLTVVDKEDDHYLCVCKCPEATLVMVFSGNLTHGQIKSCGCASADMRAATNLEKYGSASVSPTSNPRPELEIRDYLRDFGLNAAKVMIPAKPDPTKRFELDIYVPEKKLAIEHHGAIYHADDTKDRHYHDYKRQAAEAAGIRLIQIFDFEWRERNHQIKSFLKSALGLNSITVGGRQLNVKRCEFQDIKEFLNRYHILGAMSGNLYIAAFYKGDVVAAAVFRGHHVRNTGCEMSRWCVKEDYSTPGALTKVVSLAYEIMKQPIVTWADRRFSEGNGYLATGWRLEQEVAPDYFYYDSNKRAVIYKNQRRKNKVHTPAGMTETQHAAQDGLLRIWDCGKRRFVYGQK